MTSSIKLICPRCGAKTTVYHFEWSAITCMKCKWAVEKQEWIKPHSVMCAIQEITYLEGEPIQWVNSNEIDENGYSISMYSFMLSMN